MKLTAKLKKWAVENCSVKATASDDEFRKAISDAIADGSLEVDEFKSLSTTKSDEEANSFQTLVKNFNDTVTELKDALKEDAKKKPAKEEEAEGADSTEEEAEAAANVDGKSAKTVTKSVKTIEKTAPSGLSKMISRLGVGSLEADEDGEKSVEVRVKEAAESYSTTKSALTFPENTGKGRPHPFAGQRAVDKATGRALETSSDLDQAIAGAWAKFSIRCTQIKSSRLALESMPQHDRELIYFALEKAKWGGHIGGGDIDDENVKDRLLTPSEQKALFDDATSGGTEAAPIVFDDQVISTPLLNGELYPLVNVVPIPRGRRIEGVVTGTVTGSWGGVDATAISLFNTASYVSAFDTTIFRWQGAIQVGLDFLSDTPIDFGQHITSQYGERLLEDLDDVIADGNGTTQPEGVMQKTGATSVNFAGATSLGNYESLRFGVAKNEHKANLVRTAIFCGNETSYQRARAIPVGSSDARRLGGMDYSSYRWMERDYKINESLANTEIFYAIMGRYRMYRRRGLTMRSSTEGDTLIRANEMLLVATARYGGQMERGAVIARTTTAPA